MISSLLIANRGEIACRIVRTARKLGVRAIAIYSEADADALHVKMADDSFCVGPAPAGESYLAIDKILAAAKHTGAQAIHPGYGFLSENADFAEACAQNEIIFVGPPVKAILAMGLKNSAKNLMIAAGVPVAPGYQGENQDARFLAKEAEKIGYPVFIKAVAGGGGKGMRRIDGPESFVVGLESAKREASAAFGDDRVLIEKYILNPRHIEAQIFGDKYGQIVHLFERDCSLQRRHQKIIEEAPAPGMDATLRAAIGKAAIAAAKAVDYVGAGTVEFIADGSNGLREDGFWFMEMNTRLQVEHPVTECVVGVDLVEWQLRVASGEKLPLNQNEIALRGHAVEARLYAEDPENQFLPMVGKIHALQWPEMEGVRVDAGLEAGSRISPFYDPMIAKIIAHGDTRDRALDRLADALGETILVGPRTNLAFLKNLCQSQEFREGSFDTGFIDRHQQGLGACKQPSDDIAAARALETLLCFDAAKNPADPHEALSPWAVLDGFTLAPQRPQKIQAMVDGEPKVYDVCYPPNTRKPKVSPPGEPVFVYVEDGVAYALRKGRQTEVRFVDPSDIDIEGDPDGESLVVAPMHGKLIALLTKVGETVTKGQRLAVVEAMKMEHALFAPRGGMVAEIFVQAGDQVALGAKIITIHDET